MGAFRQGGGDEIIQQGLADAAPLFIRRDGKEEELGFVRNRPDK
jgi:hypothetical protein